MNASCEGEEERRGEYVVIREEERWGGGWVTWGWCEEKWVERYKEVNKLDIKNFNHSHVYPNHIGVWQILKLRCLRCFMNFLRYAICVIAVSYRKFLSHILESQFYFGAHFYFNAFEIGIFGRRGWCEVGPTWINHPTI